MGQTAPYRTPNRYITSASELLALPGFGRDRYREARALRDGAAVRHHASTSAPPRASVLDAFLGHGHTDFSSDPEALGKNRADRDRLFPDATNCRGL